MGQSSGGGRSTDVNFSTPHPSAGTIGGGGLKTNLTPKYTGASAGEGGSSGSGGSKNPPSRTKTLRE